MNAYMNQYQSNQILTASPEQILIMLYDGAIRFVRQAQAASEEGRLGDKSKAISKTIAIITEFSNTLNFEIGGDIANDLKQLYDFMIFELSAVNAKNETKRLQPVENILLDLREGFFGAAEINRQGSQPGVNAGNSTKQVAASF